MSSTDHRYWVPAVAGILLAISIAPAAAQMTPEERRAVRQACQGDFNTLCAGIKPAGGELLRCIRQHMAQVSPACKTMLNSHLGRKAPAPAAAAPPPPASMAPPPPAVAATPPPLARTAARPKAPPAPPPPTAEQLAAIHTACQADFAAHCPGVPPGGGEENACLLRNANQVSPGCQDALAVLPPPKPAAAPAPRRAAAAPPPAAVAPPPPAAYPPPPVAYAPPPPPPIPVVLRICDPDRRKLCGGVVPEDGQVVACLRQAVRVVSTRCRQALAQLPR